VIPQTPQLQLELPFRLGVSAPLPRLEPRSSWHDRLPSATGSVPHVFDSEAWLSAWERSDAERLLSRRYLQLDSPHPGGPVTPFYLVADSPMWHAYETDAGVDPVWSSPVVTTPSLYSFYGFNAATTEQAGLIVDRGLDQARQWGAAALVIGNLEPEVATEWAALRTPTAAMMLDKTYRADLSGGLEGHLAAMSGNARRGFARGWRRSVRRGVTLSILEGAAMVPRLGEMAALARDTSLRHGPSLYTLETFTQLSRVPGAALLVAEHDGEMVGAFLGFVHGESIYMWACGYDYARRAELGTYSFLLYESIGYAVRKGCRCIEVGRGNFKFKERHGFTPVELWSLIYLLPGADHDALRARLLLIERGLRAFIPESPIGSDER